MDHSPAALVVFVPSIASRNLELSSRGREQRPMILEELQSLRMKDPFYDLEGISVISEALNSREK